MKLLIRAVCALFLLSCVAHAQEKDEEDSSEFIDSSPDFSDLIIYVPKYTVSIGFRSLSGAGATFGGRATFGGLAEIGSDIRSGIDRHYHDGYVLADASTETDSAGNGGPVGSTGYTTNWTYTNGSQVVQDPSLPANASGTPSFIAMHSYTVQSDESSFRRDSKGTFGVELTGARQMGRLFGSPVTWAITTGFGINDLSSTSDLTVNGTLTTVTDYYHLDGEAPAAGGTGSSVKLSDAPLQRDPASTTTITGGIDNHYKMRGAYMTFRAGPTLVIPLFSHLSASVSVGGVLVYAGTNYGVTEVFQPETGDLMVDGANDGASEILPGYYFDANLQWSITDNSGLYLGAVYQNSGSYTQTIESSLTADVGDGQTATTVSRYTARVDLSNLQGFRAGFLLKF